MNANSPESLMKQFRAKKKRLARRLRRMRSAERVLIRMEDRYFGQRSDTRARIAAARRYPCCGQVVRLPHRLERLTTRTCRRCGRAWFVVRLTSFAELDHRGRVRLRWVPQPALTRSGATGPRDLGRGMPDGPAPA